MITGCVAVRQMDKVNLAELDAELSQVIKSAWADSTLATRNSQWGRFIRFCKANSLTPVPASVITIARFLIHLGSTCAFSTCNNYLSGIITLHKFMGHQSDFRDYFVIKLVLKGLAKRLGTHVNQKIGLTPADLKAIYWKLDFSDINVLTKWAALIFAFRTLLRKSNVVPTKLNVNDMVVDRSDVIFSSTGAIISVRKTKTIQTQDYVLEIPLSYVDNQCFDIVSMLSTHFFRTPQFVQGPIFYLFSKGKWTPLLYKDLLDFLKFCVSLIQLNPNDVGLHSLRRSGAAFLQSINVSLVDIMNSGDWKSLAALNYLISPLSRKRVIEGQVVEQLLSV